jgi:hypothetical protein
MTPADLMLSGSVMAPPDGADELAFDDAGAADEAELAGAELPGAELAALVAAPVADVAPPPDAPDLLLLLAQAALVSASAPIARVAPARRADRVTIVKRNLQPWRRHGPPSRFPRVWTDRCSHRTQGGQDFLSPGTRDPVVTKGLHR